MSKKKKNRGGLEGLHLELHVAGRGTAGILGAGVASITVLLGILGWLVLQHQSASRDSLSCGTGCSQSTANTYEVRR